MSARSASELSFLLSSFQNMQKFKLWDHEREGNLLPLSCLQGPLCHIQIGEIEVMGPRFIFRFCDPKKGKICQI